MIAPENNQGWNRFSAASFAGFRIIFGYWFIINAREYIDEKK
jgi:hypothetical protein